jgi:hypothetical protein
VKHARKWAKNLRVQQTAAAVCFFAWKKPVLPEKNRYGGNEIVIHPV